MRRKSYVDRNQVKRGGGNDGGPGSGVGLESGPKDVVEEGHQ